MQPRRFIRKCSIVIALFALALASARCGLSNPLGDADVHAVNDRGQMVGVAETASGYQGFLWDNGTLVWVGTLGGDESKVEDINSQGQMVGCAEDAQGNARAVLYDQDVITDLGAPGWATCAKRINDHGQIMGTYNRSAYGRTRYHAFFWDQGVFTDLGMLGNNADAIWPLDMNNAGQIVGSGRTYYNYGSQPFLWEQGRLIPLAPASGEARDINDRGQVVGYIVADDGATHAVRWEQGTMTELGTFGGRSSAAMAINERGQIAGWSQTASGEKHAVLWENGRIADMNVVGVDDVLIRGLNEQGQVLIETWVVGGPRHSYLWQGGALIDFGEGISAMAINDQGLVIGRKNRQPFVWDDGTTGRLHVDKVVQARPKITTLPTPVQTPEPTPAPTITPSP